MQLQIPRTAPCSSRSPLVLAGTPSQTLPLALIASAAAASAPARLAYTSPFVLMEWPVGASVSSAGKNFRYGFESPSSSVRPRCRDVFFLCEISSKKSVLTIFKALSKATTKPGIVKTLKLTGPSEKTGSWAVAAPMTGPAMKPRHANVEILPVSSVRCSTGAATPTYACSTACSPPEPMPCSSRETNTAIGATVGGYAPTHVSASPYCSPPTREMSVHSCNVFFVPKTCESAPRPTEPSASPME
mmetsp:Transcript_28420/g.59740  ORF Transcript_28420/g.59740 Transcript_28420/m.59740 type:complete len:245 (-) Transcript_28420:474-1208(-)